ncbi:MAG: sulfate ABC transporter permease subunit CysT, partial [Verrucomicrobia bacterium]|nr:sulfate ABC transporter permease subunit CysT [Verrucomicrobiota bacterium]
MPAKKFNALPGFGLTIGYTLLYLSVVVLIPIGALFFRALKISWADFWQLATTPRALAAYELTFGAAFVAALANAVFGAILAWVLAR